MDSGRRNTNFPFSPSDSSETGKQVGGREQGSYVVVQFGLYSRFSGAAKDLPLNRTNAQAKLHH
jgi:hypothetical protein